VIKADEDSGTELVERLVDLVQFNPKFISPISLDLLNVMNDIIKNVGFEDKIRNAALSTLV
jgi:hypothetical protein